MAGEGGDPPIHTSSIIIEGCSAGGTTEASECRAQEFPTRPRLGVHPLCSGTTRNSLEHTGTPSFWSQELPYRLNGFQELTKQLTGLCVAQTVVSVAIVHDGGGGWHVRSALSAAIAIESGRLMNEDKKFPWTT